MRKGVTVVYRYRSILGTRGKGSIQKVFWAATMIVAGTPLLGFWWHSLVVLMVVIINLFIHRTDCSPAWETKYLEFE